MLRSIGSLLLGFALVLPGVASWAAEADVVAVVACDPYADIKKQLRWVGGLVGQPTLDGFAESFIMMATQFKGLAGLDVARPAGIVVTAAGEVPAVHAYVPVKDVAKLLEALQGVIGPVEEADGVRRISPPGGMPLDIVEKDGWAIIGPQGSPPVVADPTAAFDAVVTQFTLGVQAFPSRMPEAMRQQLQGLLDQAAAVAAAQGQQVDQAGLAGMLENLAETESLSLGVAMDMDRERVFVETQSRMKPESPAAGLMTDMARGTTTVATAATTDGKPPALTLHLAAAVPQAAQQGAIDGLATIQAADGSDDATTAAVAILREALAAMIAAGGYDAAVSIDTSAADGAKQAIPSFTAGMKVKDGTALETRVKKLVADAGEVPGLKVAFDAGKAAGATLHTITLENAAVPGGAIDVTLAVAPTYAYVLAGGDVAARLAAVAGASGKPDPNVKPMADVNVALGPLLRFAAAAARAAGDAAADAAGLEAAAAVADGQKSALVQLLVRPIQRGMALRLSADAGAIRTVAASVNAQQGGAARPGFPATGGPDPIPFPVPAQ